VPLEGTKQTFWLQKNSSCFCVIRPIHNPRLPRNRAKLVPGEDAEASCGAVQGAERFFSLCGYLNPGSHWQEEAELWPLPGSGRHVIRPFGSCLLSHVVPPRCAQMGGRFYCNEYQGLLQITVL
jgi:hypothetical protein